MHHARRIAAIAVAAAVSLAAVGQTAAQTVTTVMSGLDNPRGLAFAPNGALYVAEAGTGSPPYFPHPTNCAVNPATQEKRCYGPTGAISRLWNGQQSRVVERLPSHAVYDHVNQAIFPDGSSASGPNDISFLGTGGAYVALGLGGGEDFQHRLGAGGPFFGTLIHVPASGRWRVVADVLAHEADENPDGGFVDSNPFGVLAEPGANLVVDAGANALLAVGRNGRIETLAAFPPGDDDVDVVPTCVARGPDGALYVGQLTGAPFAAGAARIFRVVPGEAPSVHLEGFKAIMDIAFDREGNLYVVEHASSPVFFGGPGRLTRVAPDGTRTVLKNDLVRPTAVAIGPDGAIYVTSNGVIPGAGEVLMITP